VPEPDECRYAERRHFWQLCRRASRPPGINCRVPALDGPRGIAAMLVAGRRDMGVEGGELLRTDFDNPTHAVERTDAL
jgi:hypothetical protein